jgi:hypothetical protein
MKRVFLLLCCCACLSSCKFFSSKAPGSDRDAYGCIGSAGEQWSDLQQRCIRIFEEGILLKNTDETATSAAYLVLDHHGEQAELFIPTQKQGLRYHVHPHGDHVHWNANGQQKEAIDFDGLYWTVWLQGKLLFFQEAERREVMYAFNDADGKHHHVPALFDPQANTVTLTWEDKDYILPSVAVESGYLYQNADFALRCVPTGSYLKFVKKGQEYPLHTH